MSKALMIELRKLFVLPGAREVVPGQIGASPAFRAEGDGGGDREMPFTCQTTRVARDGMVIIAGGFDKRMSEFLANPIFKVGHLSRGPAGEPTVIGSWRNVKRTDKGLSAVARFSTTPLAEQHYTLYRDGSMRMVSVEWLTHDAEMRETLDDDGKEIRCPHIVDAELLSIDAVAIGADRGALVQRATSALEQLAARCRAPGGAADQTYNRLEELLGPSMERTTQARGDFLDELGRQLRQSQADTDQAPDTIALEAAVERVIKRIFTTDPDGMLAQLIDAGLDGRRAGQGDLYGDDLPGDPPRRRGDDKGDPRKDVVTRQLTQIASAALGK